MPMHDIANLLFKFYPLLLDIYFPTSSVAWCFIHIYLSPFPQSPNQKGVDREDVSDWSPGRRIRSLETTAAQPRWCHAEVGEGFQ